VLVVRTEPRATDWEAAIAVGAQRVVSLPGQENDLMAELSVAAETTREVATRGAVIAVIAGRGGAGASVFATALAREACATTEAILIDADPWGGGIDLVLGNETDGGLRWPDLMLQGGRLNYTALREALPKHHGVCVLSGSRAGGDIDASALNAVIDAGSRGGATVVCDVARRSAEVSETAVGSADLVTVLTSADVRSCASAAVVGRWVSTVNPNVAVVVRGPAPGGLRPSDVAEIVGLPLLAAMRPQPGVAATLEHGGLRLRSRSPLAAAARRVLAVLGGHARASAA
jgi:secretion/DNA translocation related CpaE-like protein